MVGLISHEYLRDHWWVFLLRGLVAIVFGVVAVMWPGLTLAAFILLFAAFALADGAFTLIGALLRRESMWGWHLVDGIAGVAIGIIALAWPIDTAVVLLYFIAVWAIIYGVIRLVLAVRARKRMELAWLLGLTGIASLLFGAGVILSPGAGALAIVWLIGTYAVLIGVLMLVVAFRVRTLPATALTAS